MEESFDLEVCNICSQVTSNLKQHLQMEHIKKEPKDEIDNLAQEYLQKTMESVKMDLICQCQICLQRFDSSFKLKNHFYWMHQEHEQYFPCNDCEKICTTKTQLKTHLQMHQYTKQQYNYCEETLKQKKIFNQPGKRIFKCKECIKFFPSYYRLRSHMDKIHENRHHDCHICGKNYSSKGYVDEHIKIVHLKIKPFLCEKCGQSFGVQSAFRQHKCSSPTRKIPKSFECNGCGKVLKRNYYLKWHIKTCSKSAPESDVHRSAPESDVHRSAPESDVHQSAPESDVHWSAPESDVHQSAPESDVHRSAPESDVHRSAPESDVHRSAPESDVHPKHLEKGRSLSCDKCGKNFTRKISLTYHLQNHEKPQQYECSYCEKVFKKEGNLTRHSNVHSCERTFSCKQCDQSFETPHQLKTHIFRIHKKPCSVECQVCGKMYSSQNYVDLHIKLVHSNVKPFQCDKCERSFGFEFMLQRHQCSGQSDIDWSKLCPQKSPRVI